MFWFILSQSNKYSINARYLHDFYTTKKNNEMFRLFCRRVINTRLTLDIYTISTRQKKKK